MFDFKRALKSALAAHPEDEVGSLATPWGETLDPDHVLTEHPEPRFRRESCIILNGWWDYAIRRRDEGYRATTLRDAGGHPIGSSASVRPPVSFDGRILVPFSPEAPLSGVSRQLKPDQALWYRRRVETPDISGGRRLLLHFGAVDHRMDCVIDGAFCGHHEGGYLPFTFDVTDLVDGPSFEILVRVEDPSETEPHPRGKQCLGRGTIWYTAQSGIWQTVWMEVVPDAHLESVHLTPDGTYGYLRVDARVSYPGSVLRVAVREDGQVVAEDTSARVEPDGSVHLQLKVGQPHLWSPDDPFLYDVELEYGEDCVSSYCAWRTVGVERDARGHMRFCCNREPVFLRGLLDQGYWSDGLMTAPSDEALVYDIELARRLGFNMLRKHIKVESARWYYHCDRLGMLVWQDMVSGGSPWSDLWVSRIPTLLPLLGRHTRDDRHLERFGSQNEAYRREWIGQARSTMDALRDHPGVVAWTVFNEGWGQFDAHGMTEQLRRLDRTRPFDQASGWFDRGGGDFRSVHNYFRTLSVPRDAHGRAAVISEFGGLALHIAGHSAIERSYGYDNLESPEAFRAAWRELIGKADRLEEQGLAGYVYTQLSDVEEEVNGLVTYDRRVVKVDDSTIATTRQGEEDDDHEQRDEGSGEEDTR